MQVLKLRSMWGIEKGPSLENWKSFIGDLKTKGYVGIEVDTDLLTDKEESLLLKEICDQVRFCIVAQISTSVPVQITGQSLPSVEDHLARFSDAVERAQFLKPLHINSHSGADYWDLDTIVRFFQEVLKKQKALGLKIFHETHRTRALSTIHLADEILQRVPELQITADISHWVVVSENLLVGNQHAAMLERIIPKVRHIHARIGTTQASQCPEPSDPLYKDERAFFDDAWCRMLRYLAISASPPEYIAFVPEYGPFPYHPAFSPRTHSEVADSEGSRLQPIFADAILEASGSL